MPQSPSLERSHRESPGKAKPTVDKIDTLAEWLGVWAQWLRHGVTDERRPDNQILKEKELEKFEPSFEEIQLMRRLRKLPEARRKLVEELVEQLGLDSRTWRGWHQISSRKLMVICRVTQKIL
jgi:hypothetical protein